MGRLWVAQFFLALLRGSGKRKIFVSVFSAFALRLSFCYYSFNLLE
jgi:hypothetical protein